MTEIEQMQNEVDNLANQIEEICKTDKEVDDLYLGTQVYMSPLVQQTDFMFIGINPGSGCLKKGGFKPHFIKPLEKSGYETEEFQLQNEWSFIFGERNKINNLDLLYEGVKTNTCFIATEDATRLRKLKNMLRNKYGLDFSQKQKEWLKLLIRFVDPKVIICEGFEAFYEVQKVFFHDEFKLTEDWNNHKYAYLNEFTPVLGFKRIYSRFIDSEDVVETICSAMEETHIINNGK